MTTRPDPPRASAAPDWEALERSPEFRELKSARRRLLGPLLGLTALALAVYTIILITGGDGFLGDRVLGLTWGIVLVVVMTILIFILSATYSRVSLSTLDPMVERTKAAALRGQGAHRDRTAPRADEEPIR